MPGSQTAAAKIISLRPDLQISRKSRGDFLHKKIMIFPLIADVQVGAIQESDIEDRKGFENS